MNVKRTQLGLSVVELMVAMLLGLILTAGLTQIFTSSQKSFRLAEALGRTQESGRIGLDILGRSIRNADYWGCTRHEGVKSYLDTTHGSYDADIHGFSEDENIQTVAVAVASAGDSAVSGSHVLTLRGVTGGEVRLRSEMDNVSSPLEVTSVAGIQKGDILLLSDCSGGAIFQATDITAGASPQIAQDAGGGVSPGNKAGGFEKAFATGEVYRPYVHRYEVRENNGRFALYLINGSAPAVELVEDVIDMRIQVGEAASPGDTNVASWKDASAAGIDFDAVVALRVSLLVRSAADNVVETAQELCFPVWDAACTDASPTNWTATDRRKYQVYSTTTSIRNRLIPDITGS